MERAPLVSVDYEQIVQEVYEAILRPGDIAVDVGAHQGRHTFPLARCVAPDGQVFAVEPLPAGRDALRRQLDRRPPFLEDLVTVLAVALSDAPGKGTFVVAEDFPAFSGLKEVPCPAPTRTRHIPVEIDTFDALFADLPALHYVKLDAEGAELHILRGAAACLDRFRPVVGFEFGNWSNRQYGVAPQDMARFWHAQRYHVYAITGERLSETEFVRCAEARHIWDYVAVPAEEAPLNRTVAEVLARPRVPWLAVRGEVQHAAEHAAVGAALPPLWSFRGPLWPLARGCAWLFLLAARMITVPQRLYNASVLRALQTLSDGLERAEDHRRRRDDDARRLEQRVARLERELLRLREENARLLEQLPEGAKAPLHGPASNVLR